VTQLGRQPWGSGFKSRPGQKFCLRFLLHLSSLANSPSQLTDHKLSVGRWSGPSYAEAKKMKDFANTSYSWLPQGSHGYEVLATDLQGLIFFFFYWDIIIPVMKHCRAWPIVHLADCSDGRLSQLWEQPMLRPMLSVTDCLLNKPNVAIWLWTQPYQYHTRTWLMAHLPDVPIANCECYRLSTE